MSTQKSGLDSAFVEPASWNTPQDTNLTKDIKSRALHYIEEKYSDPVTQELLDITSFLDPRFKTSYISEENVPHTSKTE